METQTKTCTGCGITKDATRKFFYAQKIGKYGLHAACKVCQATIHREGRRKNRERIAAYTKSYRADKQEVVKGWRRAYYERRREQVKEAARQYRRDNPDYWRMSPEAAKVKDARRRARKLAAGGSFTKKDVRAQFIRQGGLCFWCSCDLGTAYHADHYIPLARGGSNGAENIVASCAPCNQRKGDRLPEEFMALKARS